MAEKLGWVKEQVFPIGRTQSGALQAPFLSEATAMAKGQAVDFTLLLSKSD